jgi:hypothetical protein
MLHIAMTSLPRFKGGVGDYLLQLFSALQRLDFDERYSLIVSREHERELRIGKWTLWMWLSQLRYKLEPILGGRRSNSRA